MVRDLAWVSHGAPCWYGQARSARQEKLVRKGDATGRGLLYLKAFRACCVRNKHAGEFRYESIHLQSSQKLRLDVASRCMVTKAFCASSFAYNPRSHVQVQQSVFRHKPHGIHCVLDGNGRKDSRPFRVLVSAPSPREIKQFCCVTFPTSFINAIVAFDLRMLCLAIYFSCGQFQSKVDAAQCRFLHV